MYKRLGPGLIVSSILVLQLVATPVVAQHQSSEISPPRTSLVQCGPGRSFEERIEACTVVIESSDVTDKARETAYLWRGLAHLHLWQLELAIEDFDQFLALDQEDVRVLVSRGVAYQRLEQYDRAIEDFETSMVIDPGHAGAYGARAAAYCLMGEAESAYEDFRTYMTVADDRTERRNFLRRLTLLGYEGPIGGIADTETVTALRQLSEAGCSW